MSAVLKEGDIQFLDKPVDRSCPGFRIKGHKLRWVSGKLEARRAGRIWRPIKLSKMPKGVREKLEESIHGWIDGDTIRKRDLTLAYASLEAVTSVNKENKSEQNANEAIFRKNAQIGSSHNSAIVQGDEKALGRLSSKDFD